MNCYDCTANGNPTAAVATCHDCGAGICQKHASEHDKRITAVFAWSHSVTPPTRHNGESAAPPAQRPSTPSTKHVGSADTPRHTAHNRLGVSLCATTPLSGST